ncbi:hypothetical protein [Actinomadura sp. 9N407]|uniref:hypothetical protein n=1 Tax=Actinomadura sp. 9N407 TaxID=3375154 RepID=UPI0037B599DE
MTGRHAYTPAEPPKPPEPSEEDPFERTRPDPTPVPVMGPRDRRFLECMALLTLLPILLVLRWNVDADLAAKVVDPPEKQTVVPRTTVATWRNVKWRLHGQAVGGPPPGQEPEVAVLQLTLAVKPLDDASAKGLYGLKYSVADSEGHAWTASGSLATPPRGGIATKLTVKVALPRSKTDSVMLEIRPPRYLHPHGPLPSLRFAR